jgi:hypothetical protein
MTKVTPTARQSAIAVGTVGLAAIGAVAGTVPAHAADAGAGTPINSNAMITLRGLLSPASDSTRLGLDKLPIVGGLPAMLTDMPVSVLPPFVPAALKSPGARSRKTGVVHTAIPAIPVAPAKTAAWTASPAEASSLSSLTSRIPLSAGQQNSAQPEARGLGVLPLMSNLPLVDSEKSGELLQKLAGGGLSGLGPVGELTRGLSGVAAL